MAGTLFLSLIRMKMIHYITVVNSFVNSDVEQSKGLIVALARHSAEQPHDNMFFPL